MMPMSMPMMFPLGAMGMGMPPPNAAAPAAITPMAGNPATATAATTCLTTTTTLTTLPTTTATTTTTTTTGVDNAAFSPALSSTKIKRVHVGRWTRDEHARFLEGVARFGRGNWTPVTQLVGTRDNEQVRSHAQKWLKKQRRLLAKNRSSLTHEQMLANMAYTGKKKNAAHAPVAPPSASSAKPKKAKKSSVDSYEGESEEDDVDVDVDDDEDEIVEEDEDGAVDNAKNEGVAQAV